MSCLLRPRIYEQMVRNVQVKYLDSTWTKRKAYELAMKIGYHVAELKFSKQPDSLALESPELSCLPRGS
jgi:long-subunit acyl-CoA synthetase (AMP-forming)